MKTAVRLGAAGLEESSQQCDVRWFYGIRMGICGMYVLDLRERLFIVADVYTRACMYVIN